MRQSWLDLLFIHFPIAKEVARSLVPEPLRIHEFEGRTWIGLVPFRMQHVSPRGWPDIPGFSTFPEFNVRLYVEYEGKPGVWFLSLDAQQKFAVWAAKSFFHMPYRNAKISTQFKEQSIEYHSQCLDEEAEFHARYRPTSEIFYARPGSLEDFLTSRYCFYAKSARTLYRTEVHHLPWPLQTAEGEILSDSLTPKILRKSERPLFHFSSGVDVVNWLPEKL